MNIAIGALVLCKVLISEPSSTKLTAPTPAPSESSRESVGSTNRVYGENPLQKIAQKPRIKEGGIVYTMIEGEVIDIKRETFYAPVKGTNQYEKLEEDFLVIKSKEIDHLVISGRACGLKSDFVYDEKTYQAKIKKTKAANKNKGQSGKEEVVIIRGDKIPEGFEAVVLDKGTTDALKKEYNKSIQDEEKMANDKFLQNLEHDQQRFARKQNPQTQVEILSDSEAQEQLKEIEQVEAEKVSPKVAPVKEEKTASELMDEWQVERKKQLEVERKEAVAAKKAAEEKEEADRINAEKIKPAIKTPSKGKANEKSIIKDAFEIITTE